MKHRELSKFQIKAEISLFLQKITSLEELSREQQIKYLSKLSSITDNEYVVEVLVKELPKVDYAKGQVIILFLQELATLEQLSEPLWAYIKSPDSSDELRDLAGIALKNLGDTTDPEEFLSYLDNPKEVVDKETQKLLEIASVNPEAQIDFLDFLMSLPEEEQVSLIRSLQEDYSEQSLTDVITSTFESRQAKNLDELIIKILGETRSPKAAYVLNKFLSDSEDEKLIKKAKVSLNLLKLSGIEPEESELVGEITRISSLYEFHSNIPDGLGNQAIIGSRIKPNGDVLMMNTVVNDIHGILDCFGFYGISRDDFRKIINRFQEKGTGIPVSPEYCKHIIEKAEKINRKNDLPIPYEYIAWKPIYSDIEPLDPDHIYQVTSTWGDEKFVEEGHLLYKFPDFSHWFFEEDDHELIKKLFKEISDNLIENKEKYIQNSMALEEYLETRLNEFMPLIFTDEVREIYKKRLQNTAFLFDIDELKHFRNIAASLSNLIDPKNDASYADSSFFREIIKKTIVEGLLRHQHSLHSKKEQLLNPWNLMKKNQNDVFDEEKFKSQDIEKILEILCGY